MERKATGADTNAMMTRDVGLPLAQCVASFGTAATAMRSTLLLPIRTIANRFGGSHAQRDLIHLTLVEAALRAGKPAGACADRGAHAAEADESVQLAAHGARRWT